MLFRLHFALVFIASAVPLTAGSVKLQLDGRMEFGPKWNYEYRIKPIDSTSVRSFATALDGFNTEEEDEDKGTAGPKMIDIIIKSNKSNPRLVQVAEAIIYDRNFLRDRNGTTQIEYRSRESNQDIDAEENTLDKVKANLNTETDKPITTESPITIQESTVPEETTTTTETPVVKLTAKNVQHIIRLESEEFTKSPIVISEEERSDVGSVNGVTVMWPVPKKNKKGPKRKDKKKNSSSKTEALRDVNLEPSKSINTSAAHVKGKNRIKNNQSRINVRLPHGNKKTKVNKTENGIEAEEFLSHVTEMVEVPVVTELYVKPHYVRDDPKIKEFTKHIYDQSIKTFEAIKKKLDNYEIKKEAEYLMRGYEEKFGDFVLETQNQMIKTRLGNEKVILNTVDTSNRILERLVNYLISKMDKKGYLRHAGAENAILNELNKKKELENKHICSKMQICRSSDSLTAFLIDILTTILSADDKKIIEMRDACTEVLKNTDFSLYLDPDTEKRFQKGISDLETYELNLIRPIFGMIKNILASRNTPIKVVGPEDSRVNKTVAFMEMINNFDKKLPPNDKNVLEWKDMRNSFNEWKDGKRKDTVDLIQHLTDHLLSPGSRVNEGTAFDRNINTILGF